MTRFTGFLIGMLLGVMFATGVFFVHAQMARLDRLEYILNVLASQG